jgi:hypothetical protein
MTVTVASAGAVQRYQTDWRGEALGQIDGSPLWTVAPVVVPLIAAWSPAITRALEKASFAGAA